MRKIIFSLILLLLLGTGGAGFKVWSDYTQSGPLEHDKDVLIPPGNYRSTVETLQRAGVLNSGPINKYIALLSVLLTKHNGQLHAAELHFPAFVSLQETLWILRHGRPVLHKLTVPEGLSAAQIHHIFEAAPFLTGPLNPPEEGSVLPQTYSFLLNTPRAKALATAQAAMLKKLDDLWQNRESTPEISSVQDLVVLASLIEKETALPAERPEVARVFLNRLQLGMKLQTDPTVIYAITLGQAPLGRALTHSDLQNPSKYNTYVHTGLPPGAICSPGLSALNAAAHPARGDMLYFVANGEGGHHFATTLSEHNKNVSDFKATRKKDTNNSVQEP